MVHSQRRFIACLLLGTQIVTGCTSWQPTTVRPRELLSGPGVKSIQVRDTSGAVYVLEAPRVVGDSLTGYQWIPILNDNLIRTGNRRVERRVALASIDQVGVARFNPAKSVGGLLVGGVIGLAVLGIVVGTVMSGGGGGLNWAVGFPNR